MPETGHLATPSTPPNRQKARNTKQERGPRPAKMETASATALVREHSFLTSVAERLLLAIEGCALPLPDRNHRRAST